MLNLATVIAQCGLRVLVVDSDLRRPTLHKMLRVSNSRGLTDYLLKMSTLEQVIQTTNLPTLHFLASGKLPSSSLGILGSSQMKSLITELEQRYEFVIYDSSPILAVSEAGILASQVSCLLVIEAGETPISAIKRTVENLQTFKAKIYGVVLNKLKVNPFGIHRTDDHFYYSGNYRDVDATEE